MKKVLFVFFGLLIFYQNSNAQSNVQRKKNNNTVPQVNNVQSQRTIKPVANKPPYPPDTTDLIKSNKKPATNSATVKTPTTQNSVQSQRTIKPVANKPYPPDSLLWIKNNQKPVTNTVSGKTTNAQNNKQNQQTVRTKSATVNQTKLDDLKNPFDSTKKVKASSGAGQLPESNQGVRQQQ